ncbi:hypothetical protein [Spiroplasma phoeniceum]|uniref:Uncharacterized protein n=1 Tax=Spiroplasma phoeniceum P40 TaxID=1276259 RepID=A0A345DMV5_9MOLU|nr:hypothetical protein [Spiroplasma phoeniceum]AXF95543.1 hypothetical protein SDAV_00549 [Spiroplasma phoeniceum P40]
MVYEATKLAQNFVHYMTNPFQNKRIQNELIYTEYEIYMTDISNDDDQTYTIAISTQLDYHEDATRVKELVKDYVDNDLDFLWYTPLIRNIRLILGFCRYFFCFIFSFTLNYIYYIVF